MAKGYWIVHVEVSDPSQYAAYRAVVADPITQFGGRFLVRAGAQAVMEGSAKPRPVVIEFPSFKMAQDCYNSPEYQEILKLRLSAAQADLVIAEGCDQT